MNDYLQAKAQEVAEAVQNPKSHGHWTRVNRPWWKWQVRWDSERRRPWLVKWDSVEVPCDGVLIPQGKTKVEMERTAFPDIGTRICASRMYTCSLREAPFVIYSAVMVPESEQW